MCDISSVVTCLICDTFRCVTSTSSGHAWLVTHSDVWHLLICDMPHSRHIRMCTHSWHASFVTHTSAHSWHVSFMTPCWYIVTQLHVWHHLWHASFVTHSHVWHLLICAMPHSSHIRICDIYSFVIYLMRDTRTSIHSWHALFVVCSRCEHGYSTRPRTGEWCLLLLIICIIWDIT